MQRVSDFELTLSKAQVTEFHERGFLRVPSITTLQEVVGLQAIYDRLFEPGDRVAEKDRFELDGP